MDRGACQATVHGAGKELDRTEQLTPSLAMQGTWVQFPVKELKSHMQLSPHIY